MLAVPKYHCSGHHVRALLVMHVSNDCDDHLSGKEKFEGDLWAIFDCFFCNVVVSSGCDCLQCFGAILRDGFVCSVWRLILVSGTSPAQLRCFYLISVQSCCVCFICAVCLHAISMFLFGFLHVSACVPFCQCVFFFQFCHACLCCTSILSIQCLLAVR